MGRTRPKYMGWALPGPSTWPELSPARVNSSLSLFTCYVNSGGMTAKEKKQEKEEMEKG